MTAINDLVEAAGSMGASGRLGALNEAVAGIRVPFSIIYEGLPPIAVRMGPVSAIGIAQMAGADATAEQALPVDVYSLIEEIRRSISELKARTASVPDIYTYYIPSAAQSPIPGLSGMPEPGLLPEDRSPLINEQPEATTVKRHEGREPASDTLKKPTHALDNDVIQSNLALGRLRENYAGLTWDLMEIERLIDDAMRSSAVNIPAIVSAKASPIVPSQEMGYEHIERPVPEAVVEKTRVTQAEEAGKESARDRGARLASVLAHSIGLPNAIRKSTMDMMMMQTVLAVEVPAPSTIAPVQAAVMPPPEHGQFVAAPAAMTEKRSVPAPDAVPDMISTKLTIPSTSVAQAVDTARAFNDLISSYLDFRGTATRRGAMQAGVTQLLLSLPEQQAVNVSISGLLDVMAGLQAARPKPTGALQAIEVATQMPAAATPASPDDGSMRSTILGDLREIQGMMSSLQDAVGSLRRAGTTTPVTSLTTEVPAITDFVDASTATARETALPASEDVSGELSGIYISIARLQAAMDYLKANVPTLADFIVFQRVTASAPMGQAFGMPQDVPPAGISIEGVQLKSAPIRIPDFSWVTREFGQMRGMIARFQVPMYAEGGLVEQPTLAFVGESEPEWIVPQSALKDFELKIGDFQSDIIESYGLLWKDIQDLGTSMQETVDGVNEALEGVQSSSSSETSEDVGIGQQFQNVTGMLMDQYLGTVGLSLDTLNNAKKTAGLGIITGVGSVALPFAKNILAGDEEEKKEEASGGEKEDAKEEDDEEDFWKLIDGLDQATSISNKRDGKFSSD